MYIYVYVSDYILSLSLSLSIYIYIYIIHQGRLASRIRGRQRTLYNISQCIIS